MKRTTSAAVIAASAAAVALEQVTAANAAPAPIHYQAHLDGQKIVMTTDAGDLVTDNGQLQIRDANKKVVSSIPLNFVIAGKQYPIDAQAAGRKVTLIPRTDAAKPQPAPPGWLNADPNGYTTKQQRDDAALSRISSQVGVPIAIGSLVGTAIGAAAGCLLGPGGCLAGVVLGAGVGGIAGTVGVGLPALGIAYDNYSKTVNAPFVKTQHVG